MKKISLFACLILLSSVLTGCTVNLGANLYPIKENNKYGFINSQGKTVIDCKFDAVEKGTDEDIIAVKLNGLWGYININGEMVIIPQYKEAKGFNNGLAYVVEDSYEGYINKKGQYIYKQTIVKSADKQTSKQPYSKGVSHVKNDLADEILKEVGL